MGRYYGEVQGGKGEATRVGHVSTGIRTTAKTWYYSYTVYISPHYLYKGDDLVTVVKRNLHNGDEETVFEDVVRG